VNGNHDRVSRPRLAALGLLALGCPATLFAQEPEVPQAAPASQGSQDLHGLQGLQGLLDMPAAGPPVEAPPAAPPAPPPAPPATASLSPAKAADVISAQVGARVAVRVQNPDSPEDLDDVGSDGGAMAVLSGQVHPFLKWQVGFLGTYGGEAAAAPTGNAVLLDLVAKIELVDALNLWVGRMPIPSDRANLSTEWAIAPWTLPGSYGFYVPSLLTGPRQGKNDRGDGLALWGEVRGGKLKYYLGAFGLDRPKTMSPLYSARLSLSLLDPEPGYRTSSGYYGTKRILSLGVGAQHRANGSRASTGTPPAASDFTVLGADLLLEIGNSTAGVLDLEGAFAKVWGDHETASYQGFVLVSYLVPIEIGFGRFQPLVRLQRAGQGSAPGAGDLTSIDAQLGYVIDGHHARLLVVYQCTELPGQTQNALLFGAQLLSHAK